MIRIGLSGLLGLLVAGLAGAVFAAPQATVVIDAAGDGQHPLRGPRGVATDAAGNVYVVGMMSHNAFRIAPDGTATQLIDASGDGKGNLLRRPRSLAVDTAGNVFVAGEESDTIFRVAPDGKITLVLGPDGDGQGAPVDHPSNVAVDAAGNLYVASQVSSTVHKVTPAGDVMALVDGRRDDVDYEILRPNGLAVDAFGNVFTVGAKTNNALRIAADGTVTEIVSRIGASDGHGLQFPNDAEVDAAGNTYICGNNSANVLRVKPTGEVDQLAPPSLEGMGLSACSSLAVRPDGTVYFTRLNQYTLWRIARDGRLTLLLTRDRGWGPTGRIRSPRGIAIDPTGNVFVSGFGSHAVYRLDEDALAAFP